MIKFFIKTLILFFIFSASVAFASGIGKPPNNLGLVGYWSLNDGAGTKATDFSGNRITGDLTNMDSTNWVNGKRGMALSFNGSDERIAMGFNSAANVTGTNSLTLAAWLKPDDFSADGAIIGNGKVGVGGYVTVLLSTKKLRFCKNGVVCLDSASAIYPNDTNWHHVVFVATATGVSYYVDGVYKSTTDDTSSIVGDSTNGPYIGTVMRTTGNDTFFDGLIDEARMYNRALSAAEIQALSLSGTVKLQSSQNTQVTNGLIGMWSFNGVDMITNVADASGQGNPGYLEGQTSTTTVVGKVGQALKFDGTNDYVKVSDNANLDGFSQATWSLWIKPTSLSGVQGVIDKRTDASTLNAYSIGLNYGGTIVSSDRFGIELSNSGSNPSGSPGAAISTSYLTAGQWQHVVLVFNKDGAVNYTFYINGVSVPIVASVDLDNTIYNSSQELIVGAVNHTATGFFNGLIDEVRIYNRALSATEVKALSQSGTVKLQTSQNTKVTDGLVGMWSFDGSSITTNQILDVSGNGYHGGFIGSATSSALKIGKVGQALSFNGSANYIKLGDVLNLSLPVSFSVWVKLDAINGSRGIIATDKTTATHSGAWLQTGNNGAIEISYGNNTGTGSGNRQSKVTSTGKVATGSWYHIVGVIRGASDMSIYVNGTDAGGTYSGTGGALVNTTRSAIIGSNLLSTQMTDGIIDEVRIYSKALTASEALQLYNISR